MNGVGPGLMSERRYQARHGKSAGLAADFEAIVADVTKTTVEDLKTIRATIGPPWGSQYLSEPDALKRMDEYEDPKHADYLRQLTTGQLVKLIADAVPMRKKAEAEGKWSRPGGGGAIQATGPTDTPASPAPTVDGEAISQPEQAAPPL